MSDVVLHRQGDSPKGGEQTELPYPLAADKLPKRLHRGRESFVLAGIENGRAHYRQVSA